MAATSPDEMAATQIQKLEPLGPRPTSNVCLGRTPLAPLDLPPRPWRVASGKRGRTLSSCPRSMQPCRRQRMRRRIAVSVRAGADLSQLLRPPPRQRRATRANGTDPMTRRRSRGSADLWCDSERGCRAAGPTAAVRPLHPHGHRDVPRRGWRLGRTAAAAAGNGVVTCGGTPAAAAAAATTTAATAGPVLWTGPSCRGNLRASMHAAHAAGGRGPAGRAAAACMHASPVPPVGRSRFARRRMARTGRRRRPAAVARRIAAVRLPGLVS